MPSYTVQEIASKGSPHAFAMLLRSMDSGEPFVTYGAIKAELEQQLQIPSIFTVQIGAVAGSMMDAILRLDPKAPLINVLICRPDGIPGRGAGGYLATRYRDPSLRDWENVPRHRKLALVERERRKILAYSNWKKLGKRLYGKLPRAAVEPPEGNEHDFNTGRGGEAESPEHRRLKQWVHEHPASLGIDTEPDIAEMEAKLLSGDEVDVLFRCRGTFYAVEVKSRRSNDADFRRGIYQCVKYRAVKEAEQAPFVVKVVPVLVTETKMPKHLVDRAVQLRILCCTVKLPKARRGLTSA